MAGKNKHRVATAPTPGATADGTQTEKGKIPEWCRAWRGTLGRLPTYRKGICHSELLRSVPAFLHHP